MIRGCYYRYRIVNTNITDLPLCRDPLQDLLRDVSLLKQRILSETLKEIADLPLDGTSREHLCSVMNLMNYVIMRREDLRALQERLATAGLSSLGRGESHVLANINRVIDTLSRAVLPESSRVAGAANPGRCETGHHLLGQRARKLFGELPAERSEYIMVTMPTEAASDFTLVDNLIAAGMDTARINCAHDDASVWSGMIENIRDAARFRQKECHILMDLGGHKIRTLDVVTRKDAAGKAKTKPPRIYSNEWLVLSAEHGTPELYENLFDAPVKMVVTCTCPDIIDRLCAQDTMWIDDGKIGAVIREKRGNAALLQVNRIGPKGARIKEEKGLNFPETRLNLSSLSEKDLKDLEFVSRHADMVGLSFTEQAADVLKLQEQLSRHGAEGLPVIAKIETAHAVSRLPDIIARSLARNIDLGILIARGDLAIELGSVRMAEIQEEILWLCEAAHVPVIWATQVLESLAKKGVASRPEITDAAMAVRAECVMLNKGPYILNAVSILSDVLQRMEAHQYKKVSLLRALHW
jgi:pyruvate kinase